MNRGAEGRGGGSGGGGGSSAGGGLEQKQEGWARAGSRATRRCLVSLGVLRLTKGIASGVDEGGHGVGAGAVGGGRQH